MSRRSTNTPLKVQRGATWEDSITYTDDAGDGIDLTGFDARMQVRSEDGQYGTTTATTLLLTLTTGNSRLSIDTPADQTVPCRINITVDPVTLNAALNVDNSACEEYYYALEVYDAGQSPEYVLPVAHGKVTVRGETTR